MRQFGKDRKKYHQVEIWPYYIIVVSSCNFHNFHLIFGRPFVLLRDSHKIVPPIYEQIYMITTFLNPVLKVGSLNPIKSYFDHVLLLEVVTLIIFNRHRNILLKDILIPSVCYSGWSMSNSLNIQFTPLTCRDKFSFSDSSFLKLSLISIISSFVTSI